MTEPARTGGGEPRGGPMGGRRRTGERLVALLVAGAAALNFPLLSLFGAGRLVSGIPVPFLYLFTVWTLLALGTALVLGARRPRSGDPAGRRGPDER